MTKQNLSTLSPHVATILSQGLIDELRSLIDQTREAIATTVNLLVLGFIANWPDMKRYSPAWTA